MAATEFGRQWLYPELGIWQSHVITIALAGIAAGAAGWAVLRRQSALAEQVRQSQAEKKRTQEVHELTEARFHLLFQSNPLPMMVLDLDSYRTLEVNEAASAHYGYSREEFLKLNMTDICPPEEMPAFREAMIAFRGAGRYTSATKHRTKDGRSIEVEVYAQKFEWEGREAVLEVIRDLTERRRVESENARLATAVAQAGEAVVITDTQGAIQYVNPAFARITGYSAAEALGQNPRLLKSGLQDRAYYTELWQTILRGQVWHGELINRRKDDTHYTEEMTIAPVRDSSGIITNYVAVKRDVSDRKRVETALRESEERFRLIAETITEVLWIADPEINKMLYISPGYERVWGRSDECLRQNPRSFLDAVHPEDRERVLAVLSNQKTGQAFDHEYRILRPDGSVRWIWDRGFPVRDAAGNVSCYVGVAQDISERKRAEEVLRESERKFRLLFSGNPLPMWVHDLGTLRFLEVNEAAIEHYGYSREEFLSMTIAEICPAEDVPRLLAGIEPDSSDPYAAGAWRHLRKDGSLIDVEIFAQPVPFEDRRAEMVLAIDITKRKRAEQALRESEERFRLLLDSTAEAIYGIDLNGNCTFANPACLQILGYDKQEVVLGKNMHDLIHHSRADGSPIPVAECRIFQAFESGEASHVDDEVLWRADGTSFAAEYWSYPVRREGRVVGSVVTFLDITERVLAEQTLRSAKEAAEAGSRAKSEFLANMSHEIRTPMNGILGMTDLALDTELNPEQREYLETVKTSADVLLTIINDILDFSRVEAGKIALDLIDFNLRDSLEETMKTLAPSAHQKGLEMMLDVQPEVPEFVHGDPTRLRQIVVNLIGNALKFTEQGEVMLRVEVESEPPGRPVLHFGVRDTGIGIPREKQQVIFEAFAQADASMTRRFGGTGLGLSIVASLVKLMEGRIWVESELGRGSTFHFTARFGKVESPAASLFGGARERIALRGIPVLVVDDNASNRHLLGNWLKHWGMEPELVSSASGAIESLRQARAAGRSFPIILTDAQMPETDGFTLAEEIKCDPELATATVMMLSSSGQRGDAARCKALGIAAYLNKPIRQPELRRAVIRALEARPQGEEAPSLITRHTLREEHRGSRVLLVEDNPVNRLLTLRLLEKKGYQVVAAENGMEALAALEKECFRFALLDVQMPDMDGFEVTRIVRTSEQASGLHLPIIAMTAHAQKEDRDACLAAGMDGYVAKPISARELFEVIDSTLAACSANGSRAPGVTKVPDIVW